MIREAGKIWTGVSVAMAAMIHVGVAAWAASGLPVNNHPAFMGEPHTICMAIDMTRIAFSCEPKKQTAPSHAPQTESIKPKIRKTTRKVCYTEPPKPAKAEPITAPEKVFSQPEDMALPEPPPPLPTSLQSGTVQTKTDENTESAAVSGGGPVVPPGLSSPIRPPYPKASRLNREEGEVTLWFRVRENGTAEDIRIIKSSGHSRLDRAAEEAVRCHDFIPAQRDHNPMESPCTVTIRFQIRS